MYLLWGNRMKQFFEKIWNFVKQYPFTFLFICIFLLTNIVCFISYLHFNNMIPTIYAFLSLIPLVIFGLIIFLFTKKFEYKNRFVKGIILFFINIFFWYANGYISDICWSMFCKTLTNPDTYVKIVPVNDYLVNWKQFGDGLYLNTAFICYYKDKENNHHAVITQKLLKDESNAHIDNICIKHYGEPFEYMYVVADINLTKKTDTLLLHVFFNNGHKIGSLTWDKTDPENTTSVSTDINTPSGLEYSYLMTHDKNTNNTEKKYIKDVQKRIKKNWKPYGKNKGAIITSFKVNSMGEVSSIKIIESNTSKNNEDKAIEAIKKSAPFKPLPKDLDEDGYVDIEFTFDID